MKYQVIKLSKKQAEWVLWFEKGSDHWQEAYAQYSHRRSAKQWSHTYELTAKTWFNKVLRSLHDKGLFHHCPFAFISEGGIHWKHPGFENSGFAAEARDDQFSEYTFHTPIL